MSKYPNLFSEAKIGNITLRNRTVMSPMGTGHTGLDHSFSQELVEFYAERAKGGFGMIISEGNVVQTEIDPFPVLFRSTRLDHPNKITKLADFADMVKYYNSVPCAQLSIGVGRQADSPRFVQPVSSSACPSQYDPDIMCRELTVAEIKKLIEHMAQAAEYALTAGIEIVEVHGHAGYLMDQFLSLDINKRTDEYGCDMARRFRIAREIREAIQKQVGNALAVTFRISVDHKSPNFRTLGEGLELCKLIEEAGYDGIHVDAGRYETTEWLFPPSYLGEACMSDLAHAVKNHVKIPVISVGNYSTPEVAEQALANGSADFIALGRPSLADPEWPNKAKAGRARDIRPCIMCNEMCVGRLFQGKSITCSVNPQCGRESQGRFAVTRTDTPKRVTVVGGGPAGMQTAVIAAKRGHHVTLLEKRGQLGGQLHLAVSEPFKFNIKAFQRYIKHQVEDSEIDVRCNTNANVETIRDTNPDVVVVAVGANVFVPNIKGFDDKRVMTVEGLHQYPLTGKENVIVVGGGLVGSETALGLSMQGCSVTLVEMMDDIARDLVSINRASLLRLIGERSIEVYTNTTCKEIRDNKLICTDGSGIELELLFDIIVAATGTKPEAQIVQSITEAFPEAYAIGDCTSLGKIGDAVHKGFITANSI